MKNNKRLTLNDLFVGMRVKIGIPSCYAHWSKDKDKALSWFKAKVIEINKHNAVLNVYPVWYMGRTLVVDTSSFNIIKTL